MLCIFTTMKRHPNFKTGRIFNSSGYYMIFVGKHHHLADVRGYAYEHRLIAEKKMGRKLLTGEQVHHIDENKLNNEESNLEVIKSLRHHRYLHSHKNNKSPDEENTEILCACGCGGKLLKYDLVNRPRRYIHGHNSNNNNNAKNKHVK